MGKTRYLVLVLLLFVFACSSNDNADSDANLSVTVGDDLENATEITFWCFNEQHMMLFEEAAKRWNEEHSDRPIALNAQTYPFDQMHNNLTLSLQSGKGAPDIVDIEIRNFANYLKGEVQFEEMNEYVEPLLDSMVKERFEIYAKDDKFYGLPYHVGATVMYYNKDIMDEAGVDIDSIITWNDYIEAGKQVVEKTGKTMTTIETIEQFTYFPLVSQRESNYFDANGDVILDNETNTEVLQFLHDLIYEHEIAVTTPGGKHHAEEYYGFMNDGEAASLMMPIWFMGRFIDYMPDLEGKMVIKPLPLWEEGGNRTAGIGGTGTVVTNQSKNKELAKEFLAYAKLTDQANIDLWKVMGFDPPKHDIWENEEMQEDNEYYSYFHDGIFDMLYELRDEIATIYYTPEYPSAQNEIESNVLYNVLINQSQTPEEALKEAAEVIRNQ